MNSGLPMGHRGPRLSAFVVNYNSGQFALECVRSLRYDWHQTGYPLHDLEVFVIDNDSPDDQRAWLQQIEAEGSMVISATENLGYSGAVQLALQHSSGGEDDYLAVLNPDLHFLPGSVGALMRYLEEHPECGAVAPRTYLDEECQFQLPYIPMPGMLDEVHHTLAQCTPTIGRLLSGSMQKRSLRQWRSESPMEMRMLSGCCLFMPRAVLGPLGGMILDPRYPLYYEDADLCRRLRREHLTMVFHPRARILHHWSRSAGAGRSFEGEPMKRWRVSRRAYFARHMSRLQHGIVNLVQRMLASIPPAQRSQPIHEVAELGIREQPLGLQLPSSASVLVEIGMTPTFNLCAGHLTEGGPWYFPQVAWDWLFAGQYFVRATDLAAGKHIGAWSFTKTSAGRACPVAAAALRPDAAFTQTAQRPYSDQIDWGKTA